MIKASDVTVPVSIPSPMRETYLKNYLEITRESGRLMLFAGDQKVEHLNKDFYGDGIAKDDNDPVHLFNIASKARIGVFASQLGMIARYGGDFPNIPYLVKLNSKSNLVKTAQRDPQSASWFPVSKVAEFKKNSGLNILGIGYTVYVGSEFESEMLREAATLIYEAHQQGIISVIWCYPRGKSVADEKDPDIVAGAAGIAAALGADFVKVNAPKKEGVDSNIALKQAVSAAGRTKLVCAGGSSSEVSAFLDSLYKQIHTAGTAGNATGRNVHQKPLDEAVRFCNAIYSITVEDKTAEEALNIYQGK